MLKKLSIGDMQIAAKKRGGKCLSQKYLNATTKLKWRCKNGHVWETTPQNVRAGYWCPTCGIESRASKQRLTLDECQEIARKRGGLCLSKEYVNNQTKILWQCANKHRWEAGLGSIKLGVWCPVCKLNLKEAICRALLEKIFKARFPKLRPRWLKNSRGNQMELDGYNEKLKLAFEYHGEQHTIKSFFHKSDEDLNKRKQDDLHRRRLCEQKGIKLIEVPYTIDEKDLLNYLIDQLRSYDIKIPKHSLINLHELKHTVYLRSLNDLQDLAKERGGKCLSKSYLGVKTKHLWECKFGHRWEAVPDHIKIGHWCPKCAGVSQNSLEKILKWVERKGGKCLSDTYVNNKTKIKWQCALGHIWEATPAHVVSSGRWCPYCAGHVKLTIEQLSEIAKKRGGKCLSKEYVNAASKLRWQCKKGHIWEAQANSVKNGESWCPVCEGNQKLTIEEMQKIAKEHGGKCLSTHYKNIDTKLTWQCKNGHVWEATPDNIKHGRWCRPCGYRKAWEKRKSVAN